jgi:hypothetical protein
MVRFITTLFVTSMIYGCGGSGGANTNQPPESTIEPPKQSAWDDGNWVANDGHIDSISCSNCKILVKVDEQGEMTNPELPTEIHEKLDPSTINVKVAINDSETYYLIAMNDLFNHTLYGYQEKDATKDVVGVAHSFYDVNNDDGWSVKIDITRSEYGQTMNKIRLMEHVPVKGRIDKVILDCNYRTDTDNDGSCEYYGSKYIIGKDFEDDLQKFIGMDLESLHNDWPITSRNIFLEYMGVY